MGRCGQNVATLEGGFSLVPDWVSGPYEAQVHPAPLRLRASLSRRTETDGEVSPLVPAERRGLPAAEPPCVAAAIQSYTVGLCCSLLPS